MKESKFASLALDLPPRAQWHESLKRGPEIRTNLERGIKLGNGVIRPPHFKIGLAEIVMRLQVVGIESYGFREMGQRFREIALGRERSAPVVLRQRIFG